MIISIIAAVGDNRAIGFKNSLPWKLPADLKYFKENTLGKTIVMGQKTFESIGGKPLPGRKTIILSSDPNYKATENCKVAKSLDDLMEMAQNEEEIMVSGGASVYDQFLPKATRLYLTLVHHSPEADTFFPEVDFSQWKEVKRIERPKDNDNQYDFSFVVFEKK